MTSYTVRCDWPGCGRETLLTAAELPRDRGWWVNQGHVRLDPCLCPDHRHRTLRELGDAIDAAAGADAGGSL